MLILVSDRSMGYERSIQRKGGSALLLASLRKQSRVKFRFNDRSNR